MRKATLRTCGYKCITVSVECHLSLFDMTTVLAHHLCLSSDKPAPTTRLAVMGIIKDHLAANGQDLIGYLGEHVSNQWEWEAAEEKAKLIISRLFPDFA